MIYLVIAAYFTVGTPTYFVAKDPHCATDLADVGPLVVAEAKREGIRAEISCERDPRFGAQEMTVAQLKAALRERKP